MSRVDAEQIKQTKEIDLLTYLRNNKPRELVKSCSREYRTATHSSLVFSNGFWFWHKGRSVYALHLIF